MELGPRYEFRRELGSGGMGHVLLVWDRHLGRELALKALHQAPESDEDLALFQREFALLARIEHPHIARAFDFGFLERVPYFTSEYVSGATLSRPAAPPSVGEVSRWGVEVAAALGFLHRGGVLHLDVKPSNLVISGAGGEGTTPGRIVLVDFGLVRRAMPASPRARLRGSLPFMAPEYFRDGALGPWTDLYAWGVTLYWLITGRYPRRGASGAATRLDDESAWEPAPPPPSRLRRGFPAALDGAVLRCLALEPRARYASAAELLSALEPLARTPAADASPAAFVPDLLGRDEELAAIERFLALPVGAGPAALLVTGAAGLGQTRLFQEMKIRAQTRGLSVYLERGYAGRPCLPGSLLEPLVMHLAAGPAPVRERWETLLRGLRRPRGGGRSDATEGERRQRRAAEVALAARAIVAPMVLCVDGLQLWDEVSIALLVDLTRQLLSFEPQERPPLLVAVGYREEGSAVGLLRELTQALLSSARAIALSLRPLGLQDTRILAARWSGERHAPGADLSLLQETGGVPARILASALGAGEAGALLDAGGEDAGRRVLLSLAAVERPAADEELEVFTGLGPVRLRQALAPLEAKGFVVASRGTDERPREWVLAVSARELLRPDAGNGLRRIHLTVGRELERRARREESLLVEAVRHYQAAGRRSEVVKLGPRAARYLKSTFQNKAALEMFRAVIAAAPAEARALRLEAAVECADLHVWIGETEAGLRLLRDVLPAARSASAASHARVLYRLATLHARRGESRRAASLFEEAKRVAARASGISREEELLCRNEEAALKTVTGEYDRAIALCEEGLRMVGRSRKPSLREAALNLYATRANVALRRFDHDAAAADFEVALEIAEAIGSRVNQAVILNNLGIVYSQVDRYPEATRAYREAEEACRRLDEGPSLVSIYGNLAVLHARQGDFAAASALLDSASMLMPRVMGKRQELFHEHARGLTLLYRGRYAAARPHLEAALELARGMSDRHVMRFDAVYRAEALAFEGQLEAARRALEELAAPEQPPRSRRMAAARLAFVEGLAGRDGAAQTAADAYARAVEEHPVRFLEATNELFLGWAQLLRGRRRESLATLERPAAFFRRHGLAPGAALCDGLAAEARLELGEEPAAVEAAGGNDLSEALACLTNAELALRGESSPSARARAADWLARAAAALGSCGFAAGGERLERLRARLGEAARAGPPAMPGEPPAPVDAGPQVETRDLPAPGAVARAGLRVRWIARSPRMAALGDALERLRGKELPVLIRGETGTGKELVARILHEESPRRRGPFFVVDCATLPGALLEAELFGACAGAFTDLTADRPGILALARGGTLLLDEIGGLPLEAQAKLLRVLGEGTARPLGAEREIEVDVRFLFSTSRDLASEVEKGAFRGDLLHRLGVVTLHVPPLRERPEDLPELIGTLATDDGGPAPAVSAAAIARLQSHSWPGNVRELKNLLLRIRVQAAGAVTAELVESLLNEPKTRTIFPRNLLAAETLASLRERLDRDYLVHHYRRLGGDTRALCAFLGLGRRQLYRWCARLGIKLRQAL